MPFVSHVLNGDYHFSAEQASACADWMGLTEDEANYFLLLVLWARASTTKLKNQLYKQIQSLRNNETVLKKKLQIDESLNAENQAVYYSHWLYSAVHMALLNKKLQSIEQLRLHFNVPQKSIVQIIEFLVKHKLVEENTGLFKVIKPMLHLGVDSPLLLQHHLNWRLKAIQLIQQKLQSDSVDLLNYSGVISLSKHDYEWIKQKLSSLLKEIIEKVKDSPDENLVALNFDCFEI